MYGCVGSLFEKANFGAGLRVSSCGVLRSAEDTSFVSAGAGLDLLWHNSTEKVCLACPFVDVATIAGSDTYEDLLTAGVKLRWTVRRNLRFDHQLSIGGAHTRLRLEQPTAFYDTEYNDHVVLGYHVRSRVLHDYGNEFVRWEFGVTAYVPFDGDITVILPSVGVVFSN
jgi:hypothetical protein